MSHCSKNPMFQISEVSTLCIAQILNSPPLSNESAGTHTRHQMHPHCAKKMSVGKNCRLRCAGYRTHQFYQWLLHRAMRQLVRIDAHFLAIGPHTYSIHRLPTLCTPITSDCIRRMPRLCWFCAGFVLVALLVSAGFAVL